MGSIAFHFFGLPIYWYGIIIALSILVAVFVGTWLCKKLGYKEEIPFEVMIAAVPIGILGARFLSILGTGSSITEFFNFRDGGMSIYGGVLAACLGVFIYTHFIKKCGFFSIMDLLAIAGILAQSIGRWGNFFNKEVYGLETNFDFFPLTVLIDGTPHLALFFYESILTLIGFCLLLKVFSKQKKIGTTSAVYLIYYGCVRAILEPLRETTYNLTVGPIMLSLALSILAIALGVLMLYLNKIGKISQKNLTLYKDTKIEKPEKETKEKPTKEKR